MSFRIYQRVEFYYASNINQKLENYQPITGLVEFFLQLTSIVEWVLEFTTTGWLFLAFGLRLNMCTQQPGQESSQLWDKFFMRQSL